MYEDYILEKKEDLKALGEAIRTVCDITEPKTVPELTEVVDNLVIKATHNLAGIIDRTITELVVPEHVTVIGDYALAFCKDLKKVTFPISVREISPTAFVGCSSLEHLYIGDSDYVYDFTPPNRADIVAKHGESAVVYYNDFEDDVVGNTYPAGVLSNGGYLGNGTVTVVDNDGTKALSGSSVSGMYYCPLGGWSATNANKGKSFVMSVSLKLNGIIGSSGIKLFDVSNRNGVSIHFANVNSKGQIHLNDSGTVVGQLREDAFTNVAIALNVANSTYSFYVNGIMVEKDTPVPQITASFSVAQTRTVTFSYNSANVGVLIDDITMYWGTSYEGTFTKSDNPRSRYTVMSGCLVDTYTDTLVFGCKDSVIPVGVKYIGPHAFQENLLESVSIPHTVCYIDDCAFTDCINLHTVNMSSASVGSDGLFVVGNNAFSDCVNLTTVIFPNVKTRIWDKAFIRCTCLTDVVFNDCELEHVPHAAFANCESLLHIELPDTVKRIEEAAFKQCYSLKSVRIPKMCTAIEYEAFEYCYELEDINFPADSVLETIEARAFKYDAMLKSLNFPATLSVIDDEAFNASSVPSEHTHQLTTVSFPENSSLYRIGAGAFTDCRALTTFTFPNSLSEIGPSAFEHCTSLTSVELEDTNVEVLPDKALRNLGELSVLTLPKKLRYMGYQVLTYTICDELYIPALCYTYDADALYQATIRKNLYLPWGKDSAYNKPFNKVLGAGAYPTYNTLPPDADFDIYVGNYAYTTYARTYYEYEPDFYTTPWHLTLSGETETIFDAHLGGDSYNSSAQVVKTVANDADTPCKYIVNYTFSESVNTEYDSYTYLFKYAQRTAFINVSVVAYVAKGARAPGATMEFSFGGESTHVHSIPLNIVNND